MSEDLISRQAALDAISTFGNREYRRKQGTLQDAYKLISALPSANKSGHWIDDGDCSICSKCHETYGLTLLGQLYAPNFCPNCGADMRGGDDD